MVRAIDGGTLQDNLTDIYGDGNRLVYLKDVLDLIDEQPTLTPPKEATYPCDLCVYNPPSSLDGKPCTYCPATGRPPEGEEEA